RLAQAPSALKPGSLPNRGDDKALPNVIVRTAPVELRVQGIQIPKVADVAGTTLGVLGEGRTLVIQGVRPGEVRHHAETGIVQVLRLEFEVDGVVAASTIAAADVDADDSTVGAIEAYRRR